MSELQREPVTKKQVDIIAKIIGLGAIIVELDKVDYSVGRGILEGNDRCLWTVDGKRITIEAGSGALIVSQSTEVDPLYTSLEEIAQ